jgi:SynChlorMet cassette protein ScmD
VVLRQEFDNWAILFDPDTGNAFGLKPIGVFVWKCLDGTHTIQDILKELRENCEGVPEDAQDHLKEFIGSLAEQGLPACLGLRLALQRQFGHTKKLQDPLPIKLPDLAVRGGHEYLSQYFRPWKQGLKNEGKTPPQSLSGGEEDKRRPDWKGIPFYPLSQNLLFQEMQSLPFQKLAGLQGEVKIKKVKEEEENIRNGLLLTQPSRTIHERFPIGPRPIGE